MSVSVEKRILATWMAQGVRCRAIIQNDSRYHQAEQFITIERCHKDALGNDAWVSACLASETEILIAVADGTFNIGEGA